MDGYCYVLYFNIANLKVSGYYLVDHLGMPLAISLELMLWSEVGGLVGSLTCGWISDIMGRQPLALCTLASLICMLAIQQIPVSNSGTSLEKFQLGVSLFVTGYCVNVPKTLLSLGLRQMVPSELGGSVEGCFGLLGQIGASLSGVGVGALVDTHGWRVYRGTFLSVAMTSFACMIPPTLQSLGKYTTKLKDL